MQIIVMWSLDSLGDIRTNDFARLAVDEAGELCMCFRDTEEEAKQGNGKGDKPGDK